MSHRSAEIGEPAAGRSAPGARLTGIALRLVVAAGLVVDAVIHLRLAPGYQLADPTGIGQGNLFRVEAVLAILVALLVLVTGRWQAHAAAFLVAASAVAAVILYRYVDVPALGPLPSMYEPVWFRDKTVSALAEAVAAVAALIGVLTGRRRPPHAPSPSRA